MIFIHFYASSSMNFELFYTAAWMHRKSSVKIRALPEELAESLVVGDGFVVVLSEAILDVFEAPLLHQLAGGFGLLGRRRHNQ